MESLRISATAHTVNYLPEYYANATGAFANLGLEVTAQERNPWPGVLDDLVDGTADVGLSGLWVLAMYAGRARDLVAVGQLNARFPSILVTREPVLGFDWSWMEGKTLLVPGATGATPYHFAAGLLREAGSDPGDTFFLRDLSMGMLAELFEAGLGDAILADVVTALELNRRGAGELTSKLTTDAGPMPNSVYYVRRDRLESLRPRLVTFLGAIRQAMTALTSGTVQIADLLAAEWPTTDRQSLDRAASEFITSGTWSGIRVDPDSCQRMIQMFADGGLVRDNVGYDDLIDTSLLDAAELVAAAA